MVRRGRTARLNPRRRWVDDPNVRRLVVFLVAVLVGTIAVPTAIAPAQAQAQAPVADVGAAEADFVGRINELRRGKGLRELTVHGELTDVARRWAEKMASVDEISHNPNLAKQVAADWQKLGENVGVGMTVAKLHDAFVRSPAHYRNLVDPDFTHVGVAVVIGRDGALFTTHQFMKLRPGAAAAATKASAPTTAAPAPPVTAPPERRDVAEVAAASPQPSGRLVLVLQQLRALDLS
jgi:hypothetical protein